MLLLETLLLLFQILVVGLGCIVSLRGNRHVFRYFNPYVWFSFFVFFWFLVPQFIAIFPPHMIVGLEGEGEYYRRIMMVSGQIALLLYLIAVTLGFNYMYFIKNDVPPLSDFGLDFDGRDLAILLAFYVLGVACIYYLGMQFQSLDGMRSELVKTTSGKIATAISFYGNFAFSVLFAVLIINKKYLYAMVVLGVFAMAILLTGARGRLMWPLLISMIFLAIYLNRLPVRRMIVLGFSLLMILSILDPLMISIRSGDFSRFWDDLNLSSMVESIFYRRNFDSFSNLTVVVYFDEVEYSLMRLFTGARDAFMNGYYPSIYESGVGFGVSYPGSLFLSAGWLGVIFGGFFFGMILSVLYSYLGMIRDYRVVFGYLFLMPWLAAVGGNFVESFDKMIVAISPVVVWLYLRRLRLTRIG